MTEVGKWMQQMRSGTINMTDREDWEGKKRTYLQKIPHYDIDYSKQHDNEMRVDFKRSPQ